MKSTYWIRQVCNSGIRVTLLALAVFIFSWTASKALEDANANSYRAGWGRRVQNPNLNAPGGVNQGRKKPCLDRSITSKEEFFMKMFLCRKNVSIGCQIGGNTQCHRDREAFKATAFAEKSHAQCLIEANTTELQYIRFVVKAKYLKNLNQMGSRGMGDPQPEIQRGKCTLGYTCINNQFLKDVRVKCSAFHYDAYERPFNGSSRNFHWEAPPKYIGPVIFRSAVWISLTSFYVDIDTAELVLPVKRNVYVDRRPGPPPIQGPMEWPPQGQGPMERPPQYQGPMERPPQYQGPIERPPPMERPPQYQEGPIERPPPNQAEPESDSNPPPPQQIEPSY